MPLQQIDASAAGRWRLGDRLVNRMGFGSMRLTVRPDEKHAIRVLRRAVELGVDHLDTAAFYYSPGGILDGEPGAVRYAADLIRKALRPYPRGLTIVTKVGPEPRAGGEWGEAVTAAQLRRQVEANLRLLGVEALDLVNLRIVRRPGRDSIAERFGALAGMRDEGLIRHLGISNVRLDHLDEAQRIAPVACVQNAFAVDLRRDDELLRECGARQIAFVPFFAIAGPRREAGPAARTAAARTAAVREGAAREDAARTAAMREGAAREGAAREGAAGDGPAENAQTGAISGPAPEDRIAAVHGVTAHQVRLAWTLQQGAHVLAIPGTGDLVHLEENIAAGALRLTAAEMTALDQRR